jgi:DNA-directed RNA polymerase specialized sigma24 family protein
MADAGRADRSDLATILAVLQRATLAAFPSLGRDETAEITDAAVVQFVAALTNGRVDMMRSPAAYLTRMARNLAIDRLRAVVPAPLDEQDVVADDPIPELIDAQAYREALRAAMRRARDAGDHTVTRVILVWRLLHEELGRAPSGREVAVRARLSHTAVQNTLRRARQYFESEV